MKVLIDMNLSPAWVSVFESQGWQCRHWSEIGSPSATDSEIMEWARQEDFLVFTHDLDFGALLAASMDSKPSVIQLRCEDTSPSAMAEVLLEAIALSESDLRQGALVTVNPRRTRISVLPLSKGNQEKA